MNIGENAENQTEHFTACSAPARYGYALFRIHSIFSGPTDTRED